MESLSFEGGGRIHRGLLSRYCLFFPPLGSDCGNGGCLILWDLLQDARGLHTIPGRGPQMLLSPRPQEPDPALTVLKWTESWETQNLAREGRNEYGARCSKSRSPRGHSPTTAPPDALTSCSTSAWSLSPKTFPPPAESPEPFLLTCYRCNRELELILENRVWPDFSLWEQAFGSEFCSRL